MLSNEKWFGAEAGFYPETIDQSLRFEDGDSPYLLRTPSSTGNRKTWTVSCWIKIGNTGLTANIISVFQSASPNQQVVIRFYQDKLYLYDFAGAYLISTNRVFRDTTNWYHMLWRFDSTQSTASERIKLYINGTQETDLNDNTYPSLNHDSLWNHTNKHLIGARTDNSTPTPIQEFDGYLAEFNLVDGQALGPESFGETKNGVWIPKSYSGVYGTNGFRLTFADSSNLGDDTSGNGNDFTSSGLASTDVVLDSPTNNFCTWNANDDFGAGTLSEGNTKWVATSGSNEAVASTFAMPTSGKWYWEYHAEDKGYLSHIGLTSAGTDYNNTGSSDGTRASWGFGTWNASYNSNVTKYTSSGGGSAGTNWSSAGNVTDGQVLACAYDADNGTLWFSKEGTFINSSGTANPATNTDPRFSGLNDGTQWFAYNTQYPDGSPDFFVNFGQDSSFAGSKLSGSANAQDDNGIGDFYYAPPSGFLALCSANLPDTTISPNQSTQADDHFNTVLYSGNSSNTHQITGVGFQPDWLWIKTRNVSASHYVADSSRGLGTGDSMRVLRTNGSLEEYTAENDQVRSFDPDGFTLDDNTDDTWYVNRSSDTYVAWNWKANGGTTSSNTQGSITSTVQANTDAGFSIVTYTGNNGSSGTIGHGLNFAPEVIILFGRNVNNSNMMGATSQGWTKYASFGNSSGYFVSDSTIWNDTAPTTTVFTVGSAANVNDNYNYIAYCFHSVAGFSAIGKTYTGNSSADGTFVYTGFRPAWILIKRTNGTGNYFMLDNKRDGYNGANYRLLADGNNDEYTGANSNVLDILSSGFKLRQNSINYNQGHEYIYMAFAEQPFKFSNAR
jgi:hypothetical protein